MNMGIGIRLTTELIIIVSMFDKVNYIETEITIPKIIGIGIATQNSPKYRM